MSKVFPLSLFPEQFFPDVTLQEVRFSESTLEIVVSDSEWALEPKIVLFYGPGTMIFAYSGQPRIRRRASNDPDWTYGATQEIMNRVISFDMVSRDDNQWAFRFRPDKKGEIVEVILPEMTHITWSGAGEELGDEE